MVLDLKLKVPEKPQSASFKIVPSVLDEFKLYVRAAKEENPDVTEDTVLEALLLKQMQKDKGFKAWKQARQKNDYPQGEEQHVIK